MWYITINMCGLIYDDLFPYLFGTVDNKIVGKCCCSPILGFYLCLPFNFLFLSTVVCLDIFLIPVYLLYDIIEKFINFIKK